MPDTADAVVDVPRTLGLGLAPIGDLDDADWEGTLAQAWSDGIRRFDTAPLYGAGRSEHRAGEVLQTLPRDDFELTTKAGLTVGENGRILDYSSDGIRRSLDASLGRLGLDRVDRLLLHEPERDIEAALVAINGVLTDLSAQGVVGGIGIGSNYASAVLDVVTQTDIDVALLAGRYTLLDVSGAAALDACRERSIDVVLGGVFNSGILAGHRTYDYREAPPGIAERAARIHRRCRELGLTTTTLAQQFALRNEAVSWLVIGAETPQQVHRNVEEHRIPVSDEVWADLLADGLIPDVRHAAPAQADDQSMPEEGRK